MNNEVVKHASILLHIYREIIGWYISYQHVIKGEKQILF
jgi:hypothetical protein